MASNPRPGRQMGRHHPRHSSGSSDQGPHGLTSDRIVDRPIRPGLRLRRPGAGRRSAGVIEVPDPDGASGSGRGRRPLRLLRGMGLVVNGAGADTGSFFRRRRHWSRNDRHRGRCGGPAARPCGSPLGRLGSGCLRTRRYDPAHDDIGLGSSQQYRAPATRALTAAGYTELQQLSEVPAGELKKLHGVGPKALKLLQEALEQQGLSLG